MTSLIYSRSSYVLNPVIRHNIDQFINEKRNALNVNAQGEWIDSRNNIHKITVLSTNSISFAKSLLSKIQKVWLDFCLSLYFLISPKYKIDFNAALQVFNEAIIGLESRQKSKELDNPSYKQLNSIDTVNLDLTFLQSAMEKYRIKPLIEELKKNIEAKENLKKGIENNVSILSVLQKEKADLDKIIQNDSKNFLSSPFKKKDKQLAIENKVQQISSMQTRIDILERKLSKLNHACIETTYQFYNSTKQLVISCQLNGVDESITLNLEELSKFEIHLNEKIKSKSEELMKIKEKESISPLAISHLPFAIKHLKLSKLIITPYKKINEVAKIISVETTNNRLANVWSRLFLKFSETLNQDIIESFLFDPTFNQLTIHFISDKNDLSKKIFRLWVESLTFVNSHEPSLVGGSILILKSPLILHLKKNKSNIMQGLENFLKKPAGIPIASHFLKVKTFSIQINNEEVSMESGKTLLGKTVTKQKTMLHEQMDDTWAQGIVLATNDDNEATILAHIK